MVTNEVFQKWCTTIATDTDTVLLNEDKTTIEIKPTIKR